MPIFKYFFSIFELIRNGKKITKPIKQICDVTKEMQVLKEDAYCDINTGDEIELLATNINSLYKNLLDTIDSLKEEIENVSKSEKSKVDFLRSASHELKTPLMSIHIMLENMSLNNLCSYLFFLCLYILLLLFCFLHNNLEKV